MNSWNIEQHCASVGDDFDAKMNYFKHIKCILYSASDGDFTCRNELLQA